MAEDTSEQRGLRTSTLAITRCHNDLGSLPIYPKAGDELGIMGKIGIESDDVLSGRRLETLL
jgi:hypothetical protein